MGRLESIQRYLIIIRKIKSKRKHTLKELLREVIDELTAHGYTDITASERSLKRDIEILRHELDIPIYYSFSKGYYIAEDEEFPSKNIETIMESFDILNTLQADTGLDKYVSPDQRPYRGTENLYPLLRAIQKRHPVTFSYRAYGAGETVFLKVFPYALKEYRCRWYLLGIKEGENRLETFKLGCLSNIKPLPESFRPIPDLNLSAKDKNIIDIIDYPEIPVEDVILSFNRCDGEYVESLPIHPSQERISGVGGRYYFHLYLKITDNLIAELLARGSSMQVICPRHLREKIIRIHQSGIEENNF